MRYLLDTNILIWTAIDDHRLKASAKTLLNDRENEFHFSASSVWEIAIKYGQKRRDFNYDPRQFRRQFLQHGYIELPILGHHVVEVDLLPLIHKDPFDRILIAQAMVEGITLLTADKTIASYPGPIRRV